MVLPITRVLRVRLEFAYLDAGYRRAYNTAAVKRQRLYVTSFSTFNHLCYTIIFVIDIEVERDYCPTVKLQQQLGSLVPPDERKSYVGDLSQNPN